MLRVHFTAEDLARVTVATELDPLWETMLGVQQLGQAVHGVPALQAWRRRARSVIGQAGAAAAVRMLGALLPTRGYFPDFLTPDAAEHGLRSGLDAIRGTPPGRLRLELGQLAGGARPQRRPPPVWVRNLAYGDREGMADLTHAIRAVHERVIAPDWTEAEARVEGDRARRARTLRDAGLHGLLGSLSPLVRWEPPVLHVDYPVDRDLRLAGRGLRLIPSYFCRRAPIALADPQLRPVLVYPVDHGAFRAARDTSGTTPQALAALLGRTRARTLAALHDAATTGELARRLRVSPASASQHVHVLVAANLARSQRVGSQVLHTLTPLGAALLSGDCAPPEP
ncbi:MAG: winged helix-turn-helix transcriptional regulator [Streptomyces sp.]|nr:winged helix-turn-helix transcriptional regulator [Streptomyces sp.]NUT24455.1 winged helix-turn-helix transcriptional regulator [Streptomyces sp.]